MIWLEIKILIKSQKFSKASPQNNSEIVESEIKMTKKRNIPLEKRQQVIDNWYNFIIMEYQKIINLLDNTTNQPSKLRWNKW